MTGEIRLESCPSGSVMLPIAIHPADVPAIVIMCPSLNGDINGYNDKYVNMADYIRSRQVGAVVRMANEYRGRDYPFSIVSDLRTVILHCISNAGEICGNDFPLICLLGFSAGASAVAVACTEAEQIHKILLVSPSPDAGEDAMRSSLARYCGEVYILAGADDTYIDTTFPHRVFDMLVSPRAGKLKIIENCDHQFCGVANNRILSQAPIWAFAGDPDFPDPEGGIDLHC